MDSSPKNKQTAKTAAPQIGLALCLLGRAEAVLLARGAGFDMIVVDMEHGPLGLDALGQIAAAGHAAGLPVWGRVGGPGSGDLARVLDCGASGLIVPHVDNRAQAGHIVQACRFAPLGARSIPGPIAVLDYAILPAGDFCAAAGRDVTIAAMIESAQGLAEAEAIAAVDGIDMLIIGTNDLADGMGLRGQIEHPDLLAAFRHIAAAAAGYGKAFGVMGLPARLIDSHAPDAALIVASNDTNLLIEGGAAAIAALRPR